MAGVQSLETFELSGPNTALHKPYTMDPKPTYPYCTDPRAAERLCEREYISHPGYSLSVQPGGVGWRRPE